MLVRSRGWVGSVSATGVPRSGTRRDPSWHTRRSRSQRGLPRRRHRTNPVRRSTRGRVFGLAGGAGPAPRSPRRWPGRRDQADLSPGCSRPWTNRQIRRLGHRPDEVDEPAPVETARHQVVGRRKDVLPVQDIWASENLCSHTGRCIICWTCWRAATPVAPAPRRRISARRAHRGSRTPGEPAADRRHRRVRPCRDSRGSRSPTGRRSGPVPTRSTHGAGPSPRTTAIGMSAASPVGERHAVVEVQVAVDVHQAQRPDGVPGAGKGRRQQGAAPTEHERPLAAFDDLVGDRPRRIPSVVAKTPSMPTTPVAGSRSWSGIRTSRSPTSGQPSRSRPAAQERGGRQVRCRAARRARSRPSRSARR